MKRIAATIIALAVALTALASQNDTLRILAIGNSFSQDALNQNFNEICVAAGKHVIMGNMFIPGCSLERHCRSLAEDIPDYIYHKRIDDAPLVNTKGFLLADAIADEPWDVVTFQQTSSLSGLPETAEPYLGTLVSYVRDHKPEGVRLMWHQTWAYPRHSTAKAMERNYGSQEGMYEAIVGVSRKVCGEYGMEVIPVGTAVQNLRSSYEVENCVRDALHLSFTIGRYLAACTWFEAVFKEDVTTNSWRQPGLVDYRGETARMAAHLAVAEPYAVTPMKPLGFRIKPASYDESAVPAYTLPDPLTFSDGRKVRSRRMWAERRQELLDLFTGEMYGKAPEAPEGMTFEVLRVKDDAMGGKAVFKEIRIQFPGDKDSYIDFLEILPKGVKKAPVFLGANFNGCHTLTADEWVSIPTPSNIKYGILEGHERGSSVESWPVESIIDAGFGVVTVYRGDITPDFDSSHNIGVFRYMKRYTGNYHYPADNAWGHIAAWAWGLSRVMDYLETDADVDASKVAVIGHSRLGKAALWAGATDTRFAMVISNDSGCGGAALSRRCIGETVEAVNKRFPHWFCNNFKKYNANEGSLPFDQNELLALIAPRPLYVASSSEDLWADPEGERLALEDAERVYRFLGARGRTGYHIKPGPHSITDVDWGHYIEFATKHLLNKGR